MNSDLVTALAAAEATKDASSCLRQVYGTELLDLLADFDLREMRGRSLAHSSPAR